MTVFLIRRVFQMLVVLLLASIASYALLYATPGGPLSGLRQQNQSGANRIREQDIVRIRERFELDLNVPVRFTRWLIGYPRGPITLGGQQLFADTVVGCSVPGQVRLRYPDGRTEIVEEGCNDTVTLAELEGRRVGRGALLGDFGLSQVILRDRPVSTLIASRLPYTLSLMGISTLISIVLGVLIGVYSAVNQYSRFDYVMTSVSFVGASLPTFFFAILMILVFSVLAQRAGLPYLPPGSAIANRDYVVPLIGTVEAGSFLDQVLHFIMPCLVLVVVNVAQWSRFVRGSMLEVMRQDYVRTARAKGVRERLVSMKHALRNALIPFITLVAVVLPTIFAGAAVTEAVFNWPGLGQLLVDSLNRNDYTVALALLYVTIVLQLIGYLLSDILYTVVDPRIKFS